MKMTNNDILAEYVRKKYPGIEGSLDHIFYKIGCQFRSIVETFKGSNIIKLQEMNPYEDPLPDPYDDGSLKGEEE